MGHSICSKVQLNVYDNTLSNLKYFVTMAEMYKPKKKTKTNYFQLEQLATYIVGKEASNQKT